MCTNVLRFRVDVTSPTFQYLPAVCIGNPFGHKAVIYGCNRNGIITIRVTLDPNKYIEEIKHHVFSLRMLFMGAHDSSEIKQVPLIRKRGFFEWSFTLNYRKLIARNMLVDATWLRCRADFSPTELRLPSTIERMLLPSCTTERTINISDFSLYIYKNVKTLSFVLSGKNHGSASLHLETNDRKLTTCRNKRTYGSVWNFIVDTKLPTTVCICFRAKSNSFKTKRGLASIWERGLDAQQSAGVKS